MAQGSGAGTWAGGASPVPSYRGWTWRWGDGICGGLFRAYPVCSVPDSAGPELVALWSGQVACGKFVCGVLGPSPGPGGRGVGCCSLPRTWVPPYCSQDFESRPGRWKEAGEDGSMCGVRLGQGREELTTGLGIEDMEELLVCGQCSWAQSMSSPGLWRLGGGCLMRLGSCGEVLAVSNRRAPMDRRVGSLCGIAQR